MLSSHRKIFSEGLNADDDFSVIGKGQYVNGSNLRTFTTNSGATGRVEVVGGTASIFDTLPTGTNQCIGAIADENRKRIIFFNYNSSGDHGIYAYDKRLNITYTLLLDEDVSGGLNFSKYSRIDRNAKIIGDLLYWTDFRNEPRKLNIETAIPAYLSGYVSDNIYSLPLAYTTLTQIKRPPIYPLSLTKSFDSDYDNNYIADNAYQITYRYRYKDNETSALASFGQLVPYNYKGETSNSVTVALSLSETIEDDVFAIDICVRYGNTGKTFVAKTWDKDSDSAAIALHNSDTTALSFTFYDDIAPDFLDDVTANTSFDLVPLLARTLEVARNRVFEGHILTGYNTPLESSLELSLTALDTGGGGSAPGQWGFVTLHANFPSAIQDTYMYPFVQINSAGALEHEFYYFPAVRSSTIWNGGVGTVPSSIYTYTATFAGDSEAELISYLKATQYPYIGSGGDTPGTPTWDLAYEISYNAFGSSSDVTLIDFVSVQTQQFFKSGGKYLVNIAFYDRFRRKCGVQKTGVKITIPERTYDQTSFSAAIQWALSNTNALDEIPDWAYYYQVHITKNLIQRFFLQGRASDSKYVTKNQDETYTYGTTYAFGTTYAIGIDISTLTNFGLGYTFTEGDRIKIITDNDTFYDQLIVGQDGNFILAQPESIGDLPQDIIYEIYTPYRPQVSEFYYETGPVYPISNPGTVSRTYSTLVDVINGDCYAVERDEDVSTTYIVEAMSPNDKTWQFWQTDTGWTNAVDTIGQKLLTGGIVFSDTYIEGTKVNGLNKFQPLNEEHIDGENGKINKLQLASKTQSDGSVLLAICANQTVSRYLGETELFDSTGSSSIVKSNNVIGGGNTLRGSMGTSNPESVFENNGLVWWWDTRNGCAVQYANNGLFAITDHKMIRPANLFSRKFVSLSTADIEDLGGIPFIPGGFDPYHKEALFSIPPTESAPPKGYIEELSSPLSTIAVSYPDGNPVSGGDGRTITFAFTGTPRAGDKVIIIYTILDEDVLDREVIITATNDSLSDLITAIIAELEEDLLLQDVELSGADEVSMTGYLDITGTVSITHARLSTDLVYPYDIYDGAAKTWVYKSRADSWAWPLDLKAEMFASLDNDLYAFKDGELHVCNQVSAPASFFGVQYKARIMYSNNPGALHTYYSIGLESNKKPARVHFRTEDPYTQSSDLVNTQFVNRRGIMTCSIMRDGLSPNVSGDYAAARNKGDRMAGKALLTMLEYEFEDDQTLLELRAGNIGFTTEQGTLLNRV